MYCSNCGNKNILSSRFCSQCGKSLLIASQPYEKISPSSVRPNRATQSTMGEEGDDFFQKPAKISISYEVPSTKHSVSDLIQTPPSDRSNVKTLKPSKNKKKQSIESYQADSIKECAKRDFIEVSPTNSNE